MENITPTITVYGCGGAGCNILRKFIAGPKVANIAYKAIDTAQSNFKDLPDVELIAIHDLGSGRNRGKCYGIIRSYFEKHPDLIRKASDITVLVCSMSGGSGNVIASTMTNMLYRHDKGKVVVVIGVCDGSSQVDTLNSIAALKTFEKIAKDLKVCVPFMLFSNTILYEDNPKPGKANVDGTVVSRLFQLLDLLTNPSITELDYTDKMTFLRPHETGCEPGICTLAITGSNGTVREHLPGEVDLFIGDMTIIHGLMAVNQGGTVPDILTTTSYVGAGPTTYIAAIQPGIPSALTEDLSDTADKYLSSPVSKSGTAELDRFSMQDAGGIIL